MAMSIYPEESLKPYFGESIMVGRCLLLAHFPQLRMLMHNFEGGGLPWHALCDDPVQRRLVLIVRGSVDASDWFINLSVKLTDREAHGGYWHCCGLMLTSLRPLIDEFMTAHPDYELHVTGHSLGAGLAAMLAISLKLHYPDVKGWAYACPRCIGKELAEQSTNYITSVVYGRDCVPRLAVHTIHHIFDVLQETADMDDLELLGLENVTRIIPLSSNADDTPVPSDPGLHEAENDTPYKRTSLRAEYVDGEYVDGEHVDGEWNPPVSRRLGMAESGVPSDDDVPPRDDLLPLWQSDLPGHSSADVLHSNGPSGSEQLGEDECTEDSREETHQNVFDVLSLNELERRLSRRAEICNRIFLLATKDVVQDLIAGIRRSYIDPGRPKKKSLSFAELRRSRNWDGFKSTRSLDKVVVSDLVMSDRVCSSTDRSYVNRTGWVAEGVNTQVGRPDKFMAMAFDKDEQVTISGSDSPPAEDRHVEMTKGPVGLPTGINTHLDGNLDGNLDGSFDGSFDKEGLLDTQKENQSFFTTEVDRGGTSSSTQLDLSERGHGLSTVSWKVADSSRPKISLQANLPFHHSHLTELPEFHSVRSRGCTPNDLAQSAPCYRFTRQFSKEQPSSFDPLFTPRSSLGNLSEDPGSVFRTGTSDTFGFSVEATATEATGTEATATEATGTGTTGVGTAGEGTAGEGPGFDRDTESGMEYEHSSGIEAVAALLNQVVHQDSDSEDGTPTFPWPSWLVDAFKANENSPSSLDGSSEQPNGRLSPSSPAFILPSFKKTTTGYLRMFGVYGDSDEDETGPPLRKESRTEVIHQHVIGQEEDIDHHVIGHDDDDEKVDKLQGLKKNPSFGLSGLLKKIAVHVSNLYGGDEDPDMRTKTAIDEFFQEFRTILESTNYGEELEEYGWTALRIRVEVLERVMEEYKQLLIGKIKKMEQGRDTSVSLKDQEAAAFLYSRFTKMSESDKLYVPGRIIQIIPIEHFVGSDPLWSVGPTTQSKSPSSPTLSSYRTNTAVHPIANDCPPDASIKAQMWCLLSQPGATLPSQVFIDATGCRLDWFEPVFFPSSIEDHSPASYSKGLAPDA